MTVTVKTRREVIHRDNSMCQWCGLYVDTTSGWYSLQHRRARGMGGSKRIDTDLHCNLVLVHGTGTTGCHGYIESNREEAQTRGFNLSQQQTPALVPIQVCTGGVLRWVRLDALGGLEPVTDQVALDYLESIGVHAGKA